MKRPDCSRPWSRRGAVAVMTAVTVVVLLMFATLAVDLGFVRAVCGDMQNTADSGALAGASALYDAGQAKLADPEQARERALHVIELMQKSQGFSAMEDQIVEVGSWNPSTKTFTPMEESGTDRPFAVRVVSIRNKTPLFFAAVMGKSSTDVNREAISQGSGRCKGIWGLRGIRVNGSLVTDSYESDDGAYDPATAGDEGDLCSGRSLRISGAAEINGDAMAGMGHIVEINGSAAEITGFTSSNTGDVTGPTADLGSMPYVNDNSKIGLTNGGRSPWRNGGLYVNANDNITLPPGNYYFNSITLRSGATITTSGETHIYVGGIVDAAGGGVVNKTGNPHNLSITSAGKAFEVGGTFDFYGSVLAPNADVVVHGDAQWYGALIGGTVWMRGNAEFHVDESIPGQDFLDPPPPTLVK